ncbi:metallophosphoesterase family protein [Sorangium sp. So ce134]
MRREGARRRSSNRARVVLCCAPASMKERNPPISRFAAIGDIHAEDTLLSAALDTLARLDVEIILATGDLANGAGSLDRCCEQLQQRGVMAVAGNHDRWLLAPPPGRRVPEHAISAETRQFIAGLPRTRALSTVAGSLLLCHGMGEDDLAGVWPHHDEATLARNMALQELLRRATHRLVVNGHTHEFMVRRLSGITIINAGTLRHDESPGFVVVDLEASRVWRHLADGAGRFSRVIEVELPC